MFPAKGEWRIMNKIKKIAATALALLYLLCGAGCQSSNQDYVFFGDFIFYKVDDGYGVRLVYDYKGTEVVIPSHFWFKPVTELHTDFVQGSISRYTVTKIVIPDTVKRIGVQSFYACTSLQSIEIPDSVEEIGDRAFAYCDSLQSITLPDSVKTLGESAFYSCDNLKEIVLSDSLVYIGRETFEDCISLEGITIPGGVKTISEGAFRNCVSLSNVTISYGNLGSIKTEAFRGCSALTRMTIPFSVYEIEQYTFFDCDKLKEVVFGEPKGWRTVYSWFSEDDLKDPATAAAYLTDVQGQLVWHQFDE